LFDSKDASEMPKFGIKDDCPSDSEMPKFGVKDDCSSDFDLAQFFRDLSANISKWSKSINLFAWDIDQEKLRQYQEQLMKLARIRERSRDAAEELMFREDLSRKC